MRGYNLMRSDNLCRSCFTMKPQILLLFCACVLLAPKSVSAADRDKNGVILPGEPRPDYAVTTRDGITITPVDLAPDDLREMSGAKLWRFDYKFKEPGKKVSLNSNLELRRPGKETLVVGLMSLGAIQDGEFVFGLMPTNNGDIFATDKLNVYSRLTFDSRDGGRMMQTIDNPLKSLKWWTRKEEGFGSIHEDGSIKLMSFDSSSNIEPYQDQLVLVITTEPMK